MRHLIIFAVIGIVSLLGFNIINGNSREQSREAMASSNAAEASTATISDADIISATSSSADIASQPLGQQPKAILDDATSKIDQAQQAEQERLEQMGSNQ